MYKIFFNLKNTHVLVCKVMKQKKTDKNKKELSIQYLKT